MAKPVDFTFDCFEDLGMTTAGWERRDNGLYSAVFKPYSYSVAGHVFEYHCSGQRDTVTNITLSLLVKDRKEADPSVVDHYLRMCERFFKDKMEAKFHPAILRSIKQRQSTNVVLAGAMAKIRSKDLVGGSGYQLSMTISLPISMISPD